MPGRDDVSSRQSVSEKRRSGNGSRRPPGRAEAASPLGVRLREERDRLGLSLRELARRLDVSPSLVSQIETGKTQPSVRTLYAIVSELGVSVDEMFAVAEPPAGEADSSAGPVQRAGDRRVIDLESGVRWERLTPWHDPDVDFLYAIYEVGGASSSDGTLLRHNGREFGIVLSGRLSVTVGFEEHVLGAGDSISFDSGTPHRLRNDGDEIVHAIWVVLGRYRDDRPQRAST
jgi:transcriptional regulator with XRE-family HTH domain